ncbi:MAG TPA: molecular chaperone, partial [Burkholderiaceae bacterium]|nr:molecular chaperone [Burkholderiaceae bacterium]
VFEKNQRAAQIDLNNNGTETTTYRITLVNRRMSESGEFSLIDSPRPGEQFADDLIRYSPRQVVLLPGASQTVRISLRKPADLPAGEYRSHLQFDRVPDSGGASSIAGAALAAGEVGVQLKLLVGASIPIIVRHGETAASVTLSGLELLQPVGNRVALASVVLQRSGNRSVYGDLGASFTPREGTAQEVGKAAGLAVYSPNPLRRVRLELKPPAGQSLARGTLHLSFRERPEAGGKLIAEAAIELP